MFEILSPSFPNKFANPVTLSVIERDEKKEIIEGKGSDVRNALFFVIVVNSRRADHPQTMNRADIIDITITKHGSESWTREIAFRAQISESPLASQLGDPGETFLGDVRLRPIRARPLRGVPWYRSDEATKGANTKSQKEEMSGVGFLAAVKTFTPGGRRRRRCEKQQKVLELPPGYAMQPDVVPCWDAAPPITPPAAFLPPGYKKGFPGEPIFASSVSWRKDRSAERMLNSPIARERLTVNFSYTRGFEFKEKGSTIIVRSTNVNFQFLFFKRKINKLNKIVRLVKLLFDDVQHVYLTL